MRIGSRLGENLWPAKVPQVKHRLERELAHSVLTPHRHGAAQFSNNGMDLVPMFQDSVRNGQKVELRRRAEGELGVGRQNVTAPSRTSTVKKTLDLASASGLPSVTGATA